MCLIFGKERVLLQADSEVVFFSFSINFSPSVPSFQFLGRKETELTMQMSLCSASSYKLRVISLTTLNCRQPPFSTFWLSGSVKTALKVQLFKKTLQQHNRDVRCYIWKCTCFACGLLATCSPLRLQF